MSDVIVVKEARSHQVFLQVEEIERWHDEVVQEIDTFTSHADDSLIIEKEDLEKYMNAKAEIIHIPSST